MREPWPTIDNHNREKFESKGTMTMTMNACCILSLLAAWILEPCSGFAPNAVMGNARHFSTSNLQTDVSIGNTAAPTTTSLFLAKKRRRKKSGNSAENTEDKGIIGSDDLPDFELAEDTPAGKPTSSSSKVGVNNINPDVITDAMMGSTSKPSRSVNDLISDRALEKAFVFEEDKADSSIPDFVELARQSTTSSTTMDEDDSSSASSAPGGKRARQAARRAAAIAAKEKEEEGNILKDIPFISDENGDVSGVKILESGAWLGIGLLVLWEVYLNSPLFDRAAPMVPVVYDFLL